VIQPFPYHLLPKVSRLNNRVLGVLRRQLQGGAEAWERWTGRFLPAQAGRPHPRLPRIGTIRPLSVDGLGELFAGAASVVGFHGPDRQRALLLLDGKVVAALRALLLQTDATPCVEPVNGAEQGLVVFLLAALLHELDDGCPWTVDLDAVQQGQGGAGAGSAAPRSNKTPWIGVELHVELGGVRGTAWLTLEPTLLARVQRAERPKVSSRLEWIRRPVPVVLWSDRLPLAEIEMLGQGDVIVSPDLQRGEPLSAWLRLGELEAPVTVTAGEVVVGGPLARRVRTMEQGEEHAAEAAPEQAVAESLPVELTVELGRLELTATQLMELEAGDVLTLDRPTALRVDLRVGQRLVGRGELVDVEGEAGVRLLEVFG
jgi:type III secretion system YscQ/HrcQ family protein